MGSNGRNAVPRLRGSLVPSRVWRGFSTFCSLRRAFSPSLFPRQGGEAACTRAQVFRVHRAAAKSLCRRQGEARAVPFSLFPCTSSLRSKVGLVACRHLSSPCDVGDPVSLLVGERGSKHGFERENCSPPPLLKGKIAQTAYRTTEREEEEASDDKEKDDGRRRRRDMKREGGGKGARLSWHEYGISLKSGSSPISLRRGGESESRVAPRDHKNKEQELGLNARGGAARNVQFGNQTDGLPVSLPLFPREEKATCPGRHKRREEGRREGRAAFVRVKLRLSRKRDGK